MYTRCCRGRVALEALNGTSTMPYRFRSYSKAADVLMLQTVVSTRQGKLAHGVLRDDWGDCSPVWPPRRLADSADYLGAPPALFTVRRPAFSVRVVERKIALTFLRSLKQGEGLRLKRLDTKQRRLLRGTESLSLECYDGQDESSERTHKI